ncbi:MAG TPA: hypothetical protein VLK36_16880 [Gaiellaceae bacterium]|nr:hypothetical protein [Gaiellaceae bacterium]
MQLMLARGAAVAGATLVAAALAGCGGAAGTHLSKAAADREWVANTSGVIDQLNEDVSAVASAGRGLQSARRALHDESDLFALLVAYTDFGGCNKMVAAAGEAPPRFTRVESALELACRHFSDAAELFTRAASATDAQALLRASRQVRLAAAALYRASLRFAAARSG